MAYISEAWGGRVSDKYLTEHCGILKKLLPGDVVLADRGFDIADSVASMRAELHISSSTASEITSSTKFDKVSFIIRNSSAASKTSSSTIDSVSSCKMMSEYLSLNCCCSCCSLLLLCALSYLAVASELELAVEQGCWVTRLE